MQRLHHAASRKRLYLRAHRTGNLAWATTILHGDFAKKDGGTDHLDLRYTAVLEKRRQAWLVVHEHLSVPVGPTQRT